MTPRRGILLIVASLTLGACAPHADDDPAGSESDLNVGERAKAILSLRISNDPNVGTPEGDPFPLGTTWGQRVSATWYAPYDPSHSYGWIVANLADGKGYLVRTGFLGMYEGQGLAPTFGAPLEDEGTDGVHVSIQRFARGYMTWNKEPWSGVTHLVADVMIERLKTMPGVEIIDDSLDPTPFLSGYRATTCGCRGTEGWLVVNPTLDRAFGVTPPVLTAYEAVDAEAQRPGFEALGLPISDLEAQADGSSVQRFEHGTIAIAPTESAKVTLE
jgi:hypothetical protein